MVSNVRPKKRLSRIFRFVLRSKRPAVKRVPDDLGSECSKVTDGRRSESEANSVNSTFEQETMSRSISAGPPEKGYADDENSVQSTEESEETEESQTEESKHIFLSQWVEDQKKRLNAWAAMTNGIRNTHDNARMKQELLRMVASVFGCVPTKQGLPQVIIVSDVSVSDVSSITFLEQFRMKEAESVDEAEDDDKPHRREREPASKDKSKQRAGTAATPNSPHGETFPFFKGYDEEDHNGGGDDTSSAIAHQVIFDVSEAATDSAIAFGRKLSRFAEEFTNDSIVAIDLMRKDFA